jgi:hypothetical protein
MPTSSCQHRARRTLHSGATARALAVSAAVSVALLIARPAAAAVIACGDATIAPGGVGTVRVWLRTEGVDVAGVQNDLNFPAGLYVLGGLHCIANPAIRKCGTAFALQPHDCGPGDCGWLRAIVISLQDVDPIPDGALLYTCEVGVEPNVRPGRYPVHVVRVGASTPQGVAVSTSGADCAVYVANAVRPVPVVPRATVRPALPTAGSQPAATPVPAPTRQLVLALPTAGSQPVATAVAPVPTRLVALAPTRRVIHAPTPTATPHTAGALVDAVARGGQGGCQVATADPHDCGAAPVVLALAALLATCARGATRRVAAARAVPGGAQDPVFGSDP